MLLELADGELDWIDPVIPFIRCSLNSPVSESDFDIFRNLGGRSLGGFLFGAEALAAPFVLGLS